jgi:hypothetical protein
MTIDFNIQLSARFNKLLIKKRKHMTKSKDYGYTLLP